MHRKQNFAFSPPFFFRFSCALLGMGYLLATHCCPDKLALNGPKSLTHDVRFLNIYTSLTASLVFLITTQLLIIFQQKIKRFVLCFLLLGRFDAYLFPVT